MGSDLVFKYKVKQGDTLTSIAKRFGLQDDRIIYEHSENSDLRKKRPDPSNIQPGDIIVVPAKNVLPCKTGEETPITKTGMRIIFDGHMHIQSNNCAPLPLQWACLPTISRGSLPYSPWKRANRKEVADAASSGAIQLVTGRLGPIGRLSTDLVAKLYMNELKNTDLRKDDAWIVIKKKEEEQNYNAEEMGKRAELSKMNTDSTEKYERFENALKPYYGNSTIHRMQCVQTFDLTFAHYWGRFGIPVYINHGDQLLFINDFVQAGTIDGSVVVFADVVHPKTFIDKMEISANPLMPIQKKLFHLYARHIEKNEMSFIEQHKRYLEMTNTHIETPGYLHPSFFARFKGKNDAIENLLSRKYVHLVEPIFAEEDKWREKFIDTQLPLSEGTAINFPLNFLLFYHYDPRCHCKGSDADIGLHVTELASRIERDHAFFSFHTEQSPKIKFENGESISGHLLLTPVEKLNSHSHWEEILSPMIRPNSWVFSKLLQFEHNGIHWGIKIYPRLGYAPGDWENYPQLHELYKNCVEKKVPVLAHCSEGGMAIADYYNYMRYDLKLTDDAHYKPSTATEAFANTFAAPDNWRKVLNKYKELKLCLAHFGGYDNWKVCGNFKDFIVSVPGVDKKRQKKEDTFHKWINSIAEIIQDQNYGNVYTDMSCFVLGETYEERMTFADNLVYLLETFSKLKDRLLIGTDWPMIEMSPTEPWREKLMGIGTYMTRMMLMLKEVSRKVGYDAWHQFGIINQFRFLGLLDESGQEMKVKVTELEKYKERLKAQLSTIDSRWKKSAQIKVTDAGIDNKTLAFLKALKVGSKVPSATDIKIDGDLAIFRF